MAYDFVNTIALLAIFALVVVAYSFKLIIKGRTQFDRVNRQGGSVLMGKGLMELGYWALQPIAKLLVFLHVTPNQISWASLIISLKLKATKTRAKIAKSAIVLTKS